MAGFVHLRVHDLALHFTGTKKRRSAARFSGVLLALPSYGLKRAGESNPATTLPIGTRTAPRRAQYAPSARAQHAFGFAFVVNQVKQARAQTGANADQTGDDDKLNHDEHLRYLAGSIRLMFLIQRLKLYRFKPTLAGTVATLVLLPVLLSLGFWQLRRADEKRALIAQYEIGATTIKQLSADNVGNLPLLQNVVVSGRYDASKQILLDNMPSSKNAANRTRPGYHVLTPFLLNERDIVLVNRGWVPLGQSREALPNIAMPNTALSDNLSVRGRIANLPRAGMHMPTTNATTWPRVLNFPTLQELRALYGDGLMSRMVLLDANETNGFERDWSTRYSVGESDGKNIWLCRAMVWTRGNAVYYLSGDWNTKRS